MAALPKLTTLITMGCAGAACVGGIALLVYRKIESTAANQSFVVRAIQLVKQQPATKDLLGNSIIIGKTSFDDGWIKQRDLKVRVPIKGDKDSAYLYAYARRKEDTGIYRLYKLEATFSKIDGKKLVILDRSDAPIDTDDNFETTLAATIDESTKETAKSDKVPEKKLTPEEAKQLYKERMKSWQPVK